MRFSKTFFTFTVVLFGIALAGPVAAQGWVLQHNVGGRIDDVRMVTTTTGYAVGDLGDIWKTTDGATWSSISNAAYASYDFNAVDAIVETVFVVGVNHIMRTTSGGVRFDDVSPPGLTLDGAAELHSVDFINTSIGFVVGGKTGSGIAFKTTDGGNSWTALTGFLPPGTGVLRDISCINGSICYAVGDGGKILRTASGGTSWTAQTSLTSANLLAVSAITSSSAWAVGATGVVRKTTNGSTWTNPGSPVTSALNGVDFTSSAIGMIVGTSGVAYFTDDGGEEWQSRALPGNSTNLLLDVDLVTTNAGWATTDGGVIFRFDGSGPTVGAVTPVTATAGVAQSYSTSYSDIGGTGVNGCRLYPNSEGSALMTLSSPNGTNGTASVAYTFASVGAATLQVVCTDLAGNSSSGAQTAITVESANRAPATPTSVSQYDEYASTTPEAVGYVDNDGMVVVRAGVSDPDGDEVHLELEWQPVGVSFAGVGGPGPAYASGSTAMLGLGLTDGSYHWQVRAVDAGGAASAWVPFGGNSEAAPDFTIQISSGGGTGGDSGTGTGAGTGTGTGVGTGTGTDVGTGVGTGIGAGTETGTGSTGSVSGQSSVTFPTGFAAGDLVKLPNDGNPNTFGDTAVFYLGADGNRYVFTNDKVYFSWYASFSPIRTISTTDLASIPLRGNVTYRPGVKMVKLQTSPTVYVVAARGVLRAVPSEAVAIALYGEKWNREIDDINDAFWTNYTVGTPLVAAADFNRTAVRDTAITINIDRGLTAP